MKKLILLLIALIVLSIVIINLIILNASPPKLVLNTKEFCFTIPKKNLCINKITITGDNDTCIILNNHYCRNEICLDKENINLKVVGDLSKILNKRPLHLRVRVLTSGSLEDKNLKDSVGYHYIYKISKKDETDNNVEILPEEHLF